MAIETRLSKRLNKFIKKSVENEKQGCLPPQWVIRRIMEVALLDIQRDGVCKEEDVVQYYINL